MNTIPTRAKKLLAGALMSGAVVLGGFGLASATAHADVAVNTLTNGNHMVTNGRLELNPQPLPPIHR